MDEKKDQEKGLSEVEHIKAKSRYLRGSIRESLSDELTGALRPEDQQLIKFHGTYQQWDRSLDVERKKQRLEPLYSFMIRVRVPAGVASASQWMAIDALTDKYGIGTIKLTTRQAFELHGVLKKNLKKAIKGINDCLLDTLAACGDVNRNVMSSAITSLTTVHRDVHAVARSIHKHLSPQTSAYHEIWLQDELICGGTKEDVEPIYGKTYLPRKFKIAIAVPPYNDVDVFANDIGLIAVADGANLYGFNIAVGGGMGTTFGMPETFPRLGTVIGYITKENVVDVCEKVVLLQRDNGNRSNRKLSRLKYTIERMGVSVFKDELEKRLGYSLEEPKAIQFISSGDVFGWQKDEDGRWHVTLFIEGGRVRDTKEYPMKSGLKKIAELRCCDFVLTGNQNLVLANISESSRQAVQDILEFAGITKHQKVSAVRLNSIACVSLPLCPLAFAEAETFLPSFLDKLEVILDALSIRDVPINVRMTGCPNGCARVFLGEIGMVGRAIGKYNLYLGASHSGDRLNRLYKEMLSEQEILDILKEILGQYTQKRKEKEFFGDFVMRMGIVT